MEEVIEDKLKEYYDYITIEVEYFNFRKYKIYISCNIKEFDDKDFVKGVEFYHCWQNDLTLDANIDIIKHHIDNAILRFFRKEV